MEDLAIPCLRGNQLISA